MIYRKIINETHYCTKCGKALTEDQVATVSFMISNDSEEDDDNKYMVTYELCEECKNSLKRFVHEKTVGAMEEKYYERYV